MIADEAEFLSDHQGGEERRTRRKDHEKTPAFRKTARGETPEKKCGRQEKNEIQEKKKGKEIARKVCVLCLGRVPNVIKTGCPRVPRVGRDSQNPEAAPL